MLRLTSPITHYNLVNLTIKNLSKSFGKKNVLKNISFNLKKGEIYILMGANGSGKTTLFNIVSGFLKADGGLIYWDKKIILNETPYIINRLGIVRTFQDLRLIENLSVKENLLLSFPNQEGEKWWKALLTKKAYKNQQNENSKTANNILHQTFIDDIKDQKASEISYGQQKLLTLACCIANDAKLFLLDEPVAGVNPVYRDMLAKIIINLAKSGKTLLIIEHNSDFIQQVADRILFVTDGYMFQYQDYESLINDNFVKEAYI